MNIETIEEAANKWLDSFYQKEKEYDKTGRNKCSPQLGFVAGAEWQKEQSDKQWTDEEVNSLIHYLSKYSWGHYDPVSSIMKWWELYKQSKSNADN